MIKLHDKGKLAKLADELDIPVPKTYIINNLNDIEHFVNSVDYPLVIKLKESSSSIGINYIYSPDEFILKYKHTIEQFNLDPLNYPIIQQYIRGVGCGVSLLMNHGEVRALFTHKRLREFPVTGGPATLRESIRHQEMESIAVKLLKHVKWHGLAMVEFKLDQYTNKPYLIEVNPRFWGSINQAIMSGVDFPYLLYKMAVDGDIEPVLDYRLGVRTRFLMNDVRALISQCRCSKSRVKNIKDFFKLEGMHDDILSISDPLPIILYTYTKLKEIRRTR
jgi:predicted ATP-grasp superfamily ATP-dependent carboligase